MDKHLSDLEKGQMIAYNEIGCSMRDIAEKIGRGKSTVNRWLIKYAATGETGRKKGSGRSRKTTKRVDRRIVRYMKPKRTITTGEIISDLGLEISQRTVCRRLSEAGYTSFFQRKKAFVNKRNRKKRVRWAKDHKNWTVVEWIKVLWSDESPYTFRYQASVHVWESEMKNIDHVARREQLSMVER